MKLVFGDCAFDSGTREVLRGGRASALPQRAFALLALRPAVTTDTAIEGGPAE